MQVFWNTFYDRLCGSKQINPDEMTQSDSHDNKNNEFPAIRDRTKFEWKLVISVRTRCDRMWRRENFDLILRSNDKNSLLFYLFELFTLFFVLDSMISAPICKCGLIIISTLRCDFQFVWLLRWDKQKCIFSTECVFNLIVFRTVLNKKTCDTLDGLAVNKFIPIARIAISFISHSRNTVSS